jgi:hypothetical protein
VSLRNPLEPSAAGHASREYFLGERDVPLPVPDVVARPDFSFSGGAHGVPIALRSIAPARQALDRCPIRLTHLPFSERRPADFCRGSGCASLERFRSRVTHFALSDSRSRTFAAASGFSISRRAIRRQFGFLGAEPAVTAVGFVLSQVCRNASSALPARSSKFRVGRQPPEIRFRLLSARGLGLVSCERNACLNGRAVTHPRKSLTGPAAY